MVQVVDGKKKIQKWSEAKQKRTIPIFEGPSYLVQNYIKYLREIHGYLILVGVRLELVRV